jgi:hypothetical protein
MSTNPFDDLNSLAPSQNYSEKNPFDELYEQENQEREKKLKQILHTVSSLDPDKTGEAQKLAERFNLPPGVALNSNETLNILKERNKRQNIYQLDLAQTNPILMRHLNDPNFAAIAQDNVERLGLIEGAFTGVQNFPENAAQGWEKGRLQTEQGKLGFQKALNVELGKSNETIDKRIEEIGVRLEELEGDGSGMWENTFTIGGQWSKTMQEAVKFGVAGGATGGTLGLLGGPFAPITVKGGIITGFIWGMTTGSAKESIMIEAGHQYNTLIDMGVSHETAKNVGVAVGLVNGGLEFVGLSTVVAPFKSLLIRETMQEVNKSLLKPTMVQVLRKTSSAYFRNLATEVLTEEAQELVNVAGEDFANYFETGEFESKLLTAEGRTEIAQRLAAVFEVVATGMIPIAGLSVGPTFITNVSKANKATKDAAFIDSLTTLSVTDKTKKRNPNLFESYIQNVASDKDVPNIFVDAEIFNQQLRNNGITMEQLELFSPQIANDLKEINGTGGQGDVAIPTGTYASKIAGTQLGIALQPHMRVTQDSMSATEAGQFANESETLRAEAEQILNQQKELIDEIRQDANTIQTNINEQLKATGVYTPNQTKFLSYFVRDFVVTQANQLGIKPSEFFNKYFYNITTDDKFNVSPEQQLFNQDGSVKLDTPQFKKFFGKSKLKNADGTPQVVYHGTTDNIDSFDLNHPKRLDTGWLGTGVYVTDNENLAKYYANLKKSRQIQGRIPSDGFIEPTVMPLYVRLENPYKATLDDKELVKSGQVSAEQFKDNLIAQGYDGAIMPVLDGNEIVVFDNKAVKSTFNSGTWDTEIANIYRQQTQEILAQRGKQKKGKPIPQAVYQIARIVENFDFAASKPFATNRDFKLEIQERVNNEAKKGKVDLSDSSVETEKYLVQTLLADAQYALVENPNAIGWYNEKVTKAKRLLAKVHPELTTDAASNFAFTWALATTSNGIDVNTNFDLAEDVYSYWKQNGKFPTPYGQGKAGRAMSKSFKLINELIEKNGIEDVEKFMSTTHTVKEVETYTGVSIKEFGKSEIVYGAAVIGPKIGNGFFANLYGNYEQLTLDRWAMRTWGRMTGTLVTNYTKQAKTKRDQLKQYIKALTKEQKKAFETILGRKLTLGDLDEVAKRIETRTTIPANRDLMAEISLIEPDNDVADTITNIKGKPIKGEKRISIGDEIRKAGNSLAGYLDGQKEQPKGPPERRFIEKVFGQVLPILQQQNPNLTMADLQALMWYPEKKLYDSAKLKETVVETGYEDNAAPDYANAAASLVARMGILEADIQSTLQEVDNELSVQSEEQSRDTQRDDGGSGQIREVDTFQQQGRIDETTGLPLNADGTVTVFHHTNRRAAEQIKATSQLRSAGEPDVYVTTRAITDTGYGDTAVAIRVEPSRLTLDDEFPNGRRDFRLNVGKPRGSIQVKVGEFLQQSEPDGIRGGFDPKTLTTVLTKESDFSTFLHETAHYMLTVMEDIAMSDQASQQQLNDFQTLLKFFGVKNAQAWNQLSIDQKRKFHEAFAYNYEIYLYEGKAPSTKLQEIFNKFSKFLRRIYRSIRDELNVIYRKENGQDLPILTDEIRGVMDRMLASEEQITQAEEIYGMKAMFQTQEQSGMDDATWNEYTKAMQEAEDKSMEELTKASMRQVKWLSNAKSRVLKDIQKDVEKTRKKVVQEETNKIEKEKLYRLQAFLKRGEFVNDQGERVVAGSGHKIEIASLKNLVPFYDMATEIKKLRTGQYGMVAKEGMPVSLVAEMFGFADPVEMVNALVDMRPMKEVVMERTDQRMLNEFSNLTDPRRQELQVQEAIHNEARARFISVELRFLSKSMQPVRYQVAAAKQVAKELLAKKRLKDIRPSQFSRNEIKAAKAAEAAMKKGDTLAAIKAKKSQLLNNQLAKEALEIHKTFDKAQKVFKQVFGSDKKIATRRNMDLVSAARAILAAYGLGPAVDKPAAYTDKLQAYNPDMFEQLKPLIEDLTNEGGQDIKDLTTEKFDTVYEMIQTLWYQSRRDKQVVIEGKRVELEAVVDELVDVMSRMKTPEPLGVTEAVPGFSFKGMGKTRFARAMQQGKAMLRRIEHWCDGMDGATKTGKGLIGSVVLERDEVRAGAFTRYIWRPVKDALNEYRIERTNYTKKYSQMISKLNLPKQKIVSGEFNYTFGNANGGFGKAELLGAMLHTGNTSNLRKLLLGRGWAALNEDGSINTTAWDTFVARMINEGVLTKEDYTFLQEVWDLNEQIKPLIQKAHNDVYGYYFKEVEATPTVNRYGSFRGGYVPAKTDPFLVSETEIKAKLEDLRSEFRQSLPSTGNGFTKERVEYNKPLSLDLRIMTKHIDDALRFAYVQPAIEDVFKILKNKTFANRLSQLDPTIMDNALMPWLDRSARQTTMTAGRFKGFDKFWTQVRRSTGVGIMFANIRNGLQQFTGYFPAMIKVGPSYLKGALAQYVRNPMQFQEEIAELSPFMKERQFNQIFDVQDTLNQLLINPNAYKKVQKWAERHGYFMQQAFQNQVDTVVWSATYNKVLTESPKTMSEIQVQKEAIQQADANVRLTQDSLQAEDLAAFQVGSPFYKTMVQFGGYFNMIANLNATQYKKLFNDLGWRGTKGQLFMTYLLGFAMPAFVADLIVRATGGDLDDEDEDGYLDDIANWFFVSQYRAGFALVPFGNIAIVPFNSFNDLPYDDRITTSPSMSTLEAASVGTIRTLINAVDPDKELTGKNARDVLSLLTLATGIPFTLLGRPISVQYDINRGVIDPENTPDHIRALITGKASRRSRE